MKVIEAYKFMKKIVENGEKKGYKASNIKRGVSEYLNILEEQECLSLAGLKLLRIVANSINDIIKHNVTIDEVSKYLDLAGELGIFRCGFVSLMPINEESKKEFIDFNDIFNKTDERFLNISNTNDLDICECINGAYLANNGRIIEYYARMVKKLDCPYARQLVYTSDNYLTIGFNKKTLI